MLLFSTQVDRHQAVKDCLFEWDGLEAQESSGDVASNHLSVGLRQAIHGIIGFFCDHNPAVSTPQSMLVEFLNSVHNMRSQFSRFCHPPYRLDGLVNRHFAPFPMFFGQGFLFLAARFNVGMQPLEEICHMEILVCHSRTVGNGVGDNSSCRFVEVNLAKSIVSSELSSYVVFGYLSKMRTGVPCKARTTCRPPSQSCFVRADRLRVAHSWAVHSQADHLQVDHSPAGPFPSHHVQALP